MSKEEIRSSRHKHKQDRAPIGPPSPEDLLQNIKLSDIENTRKILHAIIDPNIDYPVEFHANLEVLLRDLEGNQKIIENTESQKTEERYRNEIRQKEIEQERKQAGGCIMSAILGLVILGSAGEIIWNTWTSPEAQQRYEMDREKTRTLGSEFSSESIFNWNVAYPNKKDNIKYVPLNDPNSKFVVQDDHEIMIPDGEVTKETGIYIKKTLGKYNPSLYADLLVDIAQYRSGDVYNDNYIGDTSNTKIDPEVVVFAFKDQNNLVNEKYYEITPSDAQVSPAFEFVEMKRVVEDTK